MIVIRYFSLLDTVVAKVDIVPLQGDGWPKPTESAVNVYYGQADHDGHEITCEELIASLTVVLRACDAKMKASPSTLPHWSQAV